MSNQVATTNQETGIAKLKATLAAPSVQEQFKNALADHKDLFVSSIIDLYNGDKSLQSCNPNAIICEALKAAVLRLPINKALGFAYIFVGCLFFDAINMGNYFFRQYCKNSNKTSAL